MHPTVTIDSTTGRIGTYLSLAIAVFISVLVAYKDGMSMAWSAWPFIWAVFWLAATLWWVPRITIDTEHITLRNMIFRWVIPWSQFQDTSVNLGLIVHTSDRDIRASAAQPRAGFHNMGQRPGEAEVPHWDRSANHVRLNLDAWQAAALLRDLSDLHEPSAGGVTGADVSGAVVGQAGSGAVDPVTSPLVESGANSGRVQRHLKLEVIVPGVFLLGWILISTVA